MPLQHPIGIPTIALTISTTQNNYNVATAAASAGWDGSSPVNVIVHIASGITVRSLTTSSPAMTIPSSITGYVKLVNEGFIGGAGGAANSGTGGNALSVGASTVILVNASGTIRSGGGGGGKGGNSSAGFDGGSGCSTVSATGGNGGRGQGQQQSNAGGTAGSYNDDGEQCSVRGGTGGAGGSYGNNGNNGTAGTNSESPFTNCNCSINPSSGSGGGAAGKSINGYSNVTVVSSGTITGPTAG